MNYIKGIEESYLWICDSADEKKAMRLDGYGFTMPSSAAGSATDRRNDGGWSATGFHCDASGPTKLIDIKWLSDIDGKEYSQEEILNLAREAIAHKKRTAIGSGEPGLG